MFLLLASTFWSWSVNGHIPGQEDGIILLICIPSSFIGWIIGLLSGLIAYNSLKKSDRKKARGVALIGGLLGAVGLGTGILGLGLLPYL